MIKKIKAKLKILRDWFLHKLIMKDIISAGIKFVPPTDCPVGPAVFTMRGISTPKYCEEILNEKVKMAEWLGAKKIVVVKKGEKK